VFDVPINDLQPENALALIRTGVVDTVQVVYNVFHQQPEEQLLAECASHGVGVIVSVALGEGGLTGGSERTPSSRPVTGPTATSAVTAAGRWPSTSTR
jgi:aryl-alcohol dehydrogenase-like predicted oxidoreductase